MQSQVFSSQLTPMQVAADFGCATAAVAVEGKAGPEVELDVEDELCATATIAVQDEVGAPTGIAEPSNAIFAHFALTIATFASLYIFLHLLCCFLFVSSARSISGALSIARRPPNPDCW